MKNEEIKRLVEKYHIQEMEDGKIRLAIREDQRKDEEELQKVKEGKQEIISYLRSQKAAEIDRLNRIDAIEGLKEIEDLDNEWRMYYSDQERALEQMMETGVGRRKVKKPEIEVKDLAKKFPRAAAYNKAKHIAGKVNYEMSVIGSRAVERIIYEEDFEAVLSDMEKELEKLRVKHEWD